MVAVKKVSAQCHQAVLFDLNAQGQQNNGPTLSQHDNSTTLFHKIVIIRRDTALS